MRWLINPVTKHSVTAMPSIIPTRAVTAVLRDNRQLAERMAIMGTPTFVIGDTLLRGMPAEGLEPSVAAAREGKG